MTENQTVGLTPVQWIAARATLPEDVLPLVEAAANPGELVDALLAEGKGPEAVRCVAGALPAREGVWWAWVSARHTAQAVHGDTLPPPMRTALDALEKWIGAPDDAARRSVWAAGEVAGVGTPAGAAAAAAFLSGGSIGPEGAPNVPPPPGVSGTLVSTAVVLAAVTAPPESIAALFDAYVRQGVAIVTQLGGWDVAIAKTWQALDSQQRDHALATAPPNTPASGAPAGAQPGVPA
jgi:hypothetical protein